jgi:Thiamine pyrophosphate enzyme, C-terminal TPP binding domain
MTLGRDYPIHRGVIGDCREALRLLLSYAGGPLQSLAASATVRKPWTSSLKAVPAFYDVENMNSGAAPVHPARLVAEMRRVLPRETILFVDSGAHRAFAGHYWQSYGPGGVRSATNLGPMGWAIPAAIGGKLAKPASPVVVITGDGCMRMHGIEVATAARYGIPVIFVVSNNSALGNVYLRARKANPGAAEMTLLPTVDWAAFGRVLGLSGCHVEAPDGLAPALEEALRRTVRSSSMWLPSATASRPLVRSIRWLPSTSTAINIEQATNLASTTSKGCFMSQLPDPTNNLSSEARRIYEQIVGSRGHDYPGLFRSLMLYPELAQRFAELGTLLRFDGVLRADIRELAILTVARELRIAYIWETHQENAAKAGLASTVVADLLCGKDLSTHDALYPLVQRLVQHFLQLKPVPQDLHLLS